LPLYSWYPGRIKRQCEKLAVTTHGHWVQHTSFPAVHWFSYYQLRRFLAALDIRCLDRFDMIEGSKSHGLRSMAVRLVRGSALLRFLGHMATSYTVVFGVKSS
jgi:2-polyprenyl-6-hydroxyphenyl methylase/3-demethylubiquinone-9 3-methyltransferase